MTLEMTACPRCGCALHEGFVNAGKGPLRWNVGSPDRTILGGELLLDQGMIWGRQRTPAKRCTSCQLVLFEYQANATRKGFTPTR